MSEYQKEYDAAMAKLEAGKPTTSEVKTEPAQEAPAEKIDYAAEIEKLRKENEANAKALKDTKAHATRTSQELARIRREHEEAQRASTRPAILDANPGLEEAIKHVVPQPKSEPWAEVAGTIERAIPDLEELLTDPSFKTKVDEARASSNGAWVDPVIAIRDLSVVRTDHIRDKAIAAARLDFEKKSKKLDAMEVAGGSGKGSDKPQQVDEVKQVWAKSDADFRKERARVLGYPV